MSKGIRVLLITLGCILIVSGVAAGIYAFFGDLSPKEPASDNTEKHDDIEYFYNEDGTLKREVYYKDNVYDGQKDYHSTKGAEYYTVLDKDRNEIESSVTELNVAGMVSKVTTYKDKKLAEVIEYNYYDDLRTPSKKTVKTYKGEDEYAEKTYFDEKGNKTQVVTYLNGEITEEKDFTEDTATAEVKDQNE